MQKIQIHMGYSELDSFIAMNVIKPVTDMNLRDGSVQIVHIDHSDIGFSKNDRVEPGGICRSQFLEFFLGVGVLERNAFDDPPHSRHLCRRKQINSFLIQ